MAQKFNLKWNEFQNNINVAFKALRLERDFSDVSLACTDGGGEQIEAHKLILAASSPFFKQLLRGNKLKQPLILIKGVTQANLVAIVDFLYHGEVNILQENLESFLELSEELQLKGLRRSSKGKEQVKKNICIETKENSCRIIDDKQNEADEFSDDETTEDFSIDYDEIVPNTHIYFDDDILDYQSTQIQIADEIMEEEVTQEEVKDDRVEDGDLEKMDEIQGKEETSGLEESYENVRKCENAFESFISHPEKRHNNFFPTSIIEDELVSNSPDRDLMLNHDAKIKSKMEKGQNYISNGKRRALAQLCKVCGKEGLGKNIQDHIEAKHIDGIVLPCFYCEKTFTSRNGLRLHKKKIHGDLKNRQSTGEEMKESKMELEEELSAATLSEAKNWNLAR